MEELKHDIAPAAKKLSLSIFGDALNSEFSPKNIVSPPHTQREHTGTTPRVMTFSMFGNTHVVAESLHRDARKLSAIDDPEVSPNKKKSLSARTSAITNAGGGAGAGGGGGGGSVPVAAPPKRKSVDETLDYIKAAALDAEIMMMEDDTENLEDQVPASESGNSQSSEICPYYLKGGCRFRKNCRLSHNIGPNCPYCGQDLPQTWTQQSKHLKRCWESGVEAEEWELSKSLQCEICEEGIHASRLNFALLASCQHSVCTPCAEKIWDNRKQLLKCPSCDTVSTCVMIRDRMYFDADRKSKMFGIYQKKLEARKARSQVMSGSYGGGGGSRRLSNTNSADQKRGRSSNPSRS